MLQTPLATQLLQQSQLEAELKRQDEANRYAVWREEQLKTMGPYYDVLAHIKAAYEKMGDTFEVSEDNDPTVAQRKSVALADSKGTEEVILGLPAKCTPRSVKQESTETNTLQQSNTNMNDTETTIAPSSKRADDALNSLPKEPIVSVDEVPVIKQVRRDRTRPNPSKRPRRHKKQIYYQNEVELPSTVKKNDVLRKIQQYQRTGELFIPRRVFRRSVKKICNDLSVCPMRMQANAIEALQYMAEATITSMFEDAVLIAVNSKRVTVMQNDLQLIRRFYGL